ncbi:UNKNOWN [Stylonychia lemnae]|uniref:Uncharacterized protein n=1 Tax=Stylonychia lemnae TaxID=5949 RepID=A0A078A8Q4_STYLE|nr:UNKNOWN [Stylonychia lemnae]|eukprot:CDW78609.1 UNKNOWN [Stylonychia lemnae]
MFQIWSTYDQRKFRFQVGWKKLKENHWRAGFPFIHACLFAGTYGGYKLSKKKWPVLKKRYRIPQLIFAYYFTGHFAHKLFKRPDYYQTYTPLEAKYRLDFYNEGYGAFHLKEGHTWEEVEDIHFFILDDKEALVNDAQNIELAKAFILETDRYLKKRRMQNPDYTSIRSLSDEEIKCLFDSKNEGIDIIPGCLDRFEEQQNMLIKEQQKLQAEQQEKALLAQQNLELQNIQNSPANVQNQDYKKNDL